METNDKTTLNPKILQRLQGKIFIAEQNNMLTNEKTDSQMVEKLVNMIKEEANKSW